MLEIVILPLFLKNLSNGMYCLFLWVVVILELDIHPDHNKGPDPRTLPHYITDKQLFDLHALNLEVITVHGNELRMTETKLFLLIVLLMSRI